MRAIFRLCLTFGFFLTVLATSKSQAAAPRDVTIDNNGALLKGKFYVAEGAGSFPTVILLHGFPGNETDVFGFGSKLSETGVNALTFNYSGTFQSQGQMNMENAQKDIRAAFDFIHRQENVVAYKIDTARILLGGWCFGGGMALGYAAGHPEITAVFSIAGNDHGEFFREYARNPEMKKMVDDMFAAVAAPTGPVRFAKGALPKEIVEAGLDKLNPIFDLRKSAPNLIQKDILLIGGWDDRQVTIEQFVLPFYRALEKENAKNVKIMAFQDDHYFKNSRAEVALTVIEWLKTILGTKTAHGSSLEASLKDSSFDEAAANKYGADAYGMKKYVLAFLKRGPNRPTDPKKVEELQTAHLKNIDRMAEEGKLILAGPFLDNSALRGIYVFNVATIAEAEKLTNSDPAIQAGSLVMELKEWYGSAALMAVNAIHRKLSKESITGENN